MIQLVRTYPHRSPLVSSTPRASYQWQPRVKIFTLVDGVSLIAAHNLLVNKLNMSSLTPTSFLARTTVRCKYHFACVSVLFWLSRSIMSFDPPAGLYCCLSTRWMPVSSCVMAAWVYCPLSLRQRLNCLILATIDCLVAVLAVKHVSSMLVFRNDSQLGKRW